MKRVLMARILHVELCLRFSMIIISRIYIQSYKDLKSCSMKYQPGYTCTWCLHMCQYVMSSHSSFAECHQKEETQPIGQDKKDGCICNMNMPDG